jgi:ATP-binding cassette subfamily F protein uup
MEELADAQARSASGSAAIDFTATGRKTKRLLALHGVSKQLGGRALFGSLSFVLGPGTRLGLLGPNGCGKTTLLRLLSGEAKPDAGQIERADLLKVVYFDQDRRALDPAQPLRRALCPEGDTVLYRERPMHVNGWAKRFLFRPEQLEQPVASLSGGEQARLLIARLMLQPADLLLLDEPTNDLDIPTLEVLEESLLDFPGALVLVTHDRYLLDRVSTVLLALDGEGGSEFFADFSQWEQAQTARRAAKPRESAPVRAPVAAAPKRKLSYLEAREYEQMEQRIVEAETELSVCEARLHAPDVVSDPRELERAYRAFEEAKTAVDLLYARWAELESKRA